MVMVCESLALCFSSSRSLSTAPGSPRTFLRVIDVKGRRGPVLTSRRPGILVLINDADWELEGELEYELKDRDEVVFISTLHGG